MTDPTRPAQAEATSTEAEAQHPERTGRPAGTTGTPAAAARRDVAELLARLEANWERGDDAANDDLVAEYCADARRRQRALRELPADARPRTPGADDGALPSEPGSS